MEDIRVTCHDGSSAGGLLVPMVSSAQ